jgi:PAS domain-containing protein
VRWRLPIARIEAAGQASEATGISFPVTLHGGDTAVGSSYVDQTEITASRRRLTELNKLYDGLFERSNIPIAIYGTDHRLRDANPAYCRLLRYERHTSSARTSVNSSRPAQPRCTQASGSASSPAAATDTTV